MELQNGYTLTNPLPVPVEVDPVQNLIDRVELGPLADGTLDDVALAIADLADEIDALTARRDRLRKALLERLLTDGLQKTETKQVKVAVQTGARRVKLLVKPEALPERFQLLTSNDKEIKQAVDDGEDLSPYLSLVDSSPFVRITPKLKRG